MPLTSESLSALVGLFMPLIVDLVKINVNPKNPKGTKIINYTISIVTSILVAFGFSFVEGSFSMQNWLASVGAILVASQGVYNYWWKPQDLEKISRSLNKDILKLVRIK